MAIKPSQHYPKTFKTIQVPWRDISMDNARPCTERSYVEIITDNQRELVEVMTVANSMDIRGLPDCVVTDPFDQVPALRYPSDAPKVPREYRVSLQMSAKNGVFDEIAEVIAKAKDMRRTSRIDKLVILHPDFAAFFRKLWSARYCHASGEISGKGVRRMMADIRHNTIRGEDPRRSVITKMVAANIGRMNPNKVARLIRRKMKG